MTADFPAKRVDLAHEPDFSLGGILVRPATRQVVAGATSETVEPRVMQVLVMLSRHAGEVVSRDDLIQTCWEGRIVSEDALNRCISKVRKLQEATGAFQLETIPKVGYRLTAETAPANPSPDPVARAPAAPASHPAASPDPQPASLPGRQLPGLEWPGGKLDVRLIAGLAAALLVALALGAWAGLFSPKPPAEPRMMTLAVLPFANLSAQADDKLLATGVARGMRNSLSEMTGLRVLSDVSTFAAADGGASAQDIGRTLSADWLLDGGFTRSGETIELTAELVDTTNGANFWTGRESGPAADVGRIQQILLSRIVEAILPRIDRGAPLAPPKPQDPRIYPLVRQAWELTNNSGAIDQAEMLKRGDKAWDLLQQALAIDPESSDALVALAVMTSRPMSTAQFNSTEPNLQRQMRAAALVRRALASNPNNAEAMTILADHYRRFEWRWAEAAALLERSLQLNPNHLYLRQYASFYFLSVGDCVASLEQAEAAVRLAPNLSGPKRVTTRPLRCLGRYKESHDILMSLLKEEPANLSFMSEAYLALLLIRDADELRRTADRIDRDFFKDAPPPEVATMTARMRLAADMLQGRRKEEFLALVRADVDRMIGPDAPPFLNDRLGNDALYILAIELAWAGDAKGAAVALEAAIASGSLYITETMPYGASEFPEEVRAQPQYRRAWTEDQRLVELTRLRKENLDKRRMAGRLPDGTLVMPKE